MHLPPWLWPHDTAERSLRLSALALIGTALALIGTAIQFIVNERRRREGVSVKAELHYRIRRQDLHLYPTVVQRMNPSVGEDCIRLTVKYRGRHSVRVVDARFEIACWTETFQFDPPMGPCTLYDGQSKRVLLVPRMYDLSAVTGFAVHTETHGVIFKPVRKFLRFQYENLYGRPRLYQFLQRVTGVPHVTRPSDMSPKRCPKCRAPGDYVGHTDSAVETGPVMDVSRCFTCGKCSHRWWAESTDPVPTDAP